MENSTTFRTEPQAVEEIAESPKPLEKAPATGSSPDVEVPVALRGEVTGTPYTAEFYEVTSIWDKPEMRMKQEVYAIDSYYKEKVERGVIEDGKKNYEKFIRGLEKAIGVSDLTPKGTRISKLFEYIKFMRKAEQIDNSK